jgi:hypothetical protein
MHFTIRLLFLRTTYMPVGSTLLGRAEGVCIILNLAFRKKSLEPPIPFNIPDPHTMVELAWPYISNSTGVFIAITPNRLMISGLFETCWERSNSLSYSRQWRVWKFSWIAHFVSSYFLVSSHLITLPVVVKMLKTIRRETNRCSTGKLQFPRIKEFKESILQDFGKAVVNFWEPISPDINFFFSPNKIKKKKSSKNNLHCNILKRTVG